MREENGFTLVELMVTLAIAAILLTQAVPSFSSMVRNNRAATQSNSLSGSLNLARSESVKRGMRVTVCSRANPSTVPESCAGSTNWAGGWLVFIDNAGVTGSFDGADELIRVQEPLSGNPTLTGTVNNLQYQSTGDVSRSTTFTLTPSGCQGIQTRSIDISRTGRVSVSVISCV